MREIKFRGWQDNKMIYQGANGVYPMKRFFLHLKDNVILMQYIGVKDSKGTEIYDGDIVRVYTYIDEDEPKFNEFTIHKVFWGGMKYPAFELFPNLGDDSNGFSSILCGDYFEALEVIGNIHETPELLTEAKNV